MSTIYDSGLEYDALAIGHDVGSETSFYASLVPPDSSVLELAYGTGRLAIPLAERGFDITGLDNSGAMLIAAEAKAALRGVSPVFVSADMRDFSLKMPFDLIFLPNNSLGHLHSLADIRSCFACVLRHLPPRGSFIVDMFNPSLPLLLRPPNTQYPVTEYTRPGGKTVSVSETVSYDPAVQISYAHWRYQAENEPAVIHPLDLRIFFPQELDALLTLSGFSIDAKYGDFDQSPFTGASPRQVIVCRKA